MFISNINSSSSPPSNFYIDKSIFMKKSPMPLLLDGVTKLKFTSSYISKKSESALTIYFVVAVINAVSTERDFIILPHFVDYLFLLI